MSSRTRCQKFETRLPQVAVPRVLSPPTPAYTAPHTRFAWTMNMFVLARYCCHKRSLTPCVPGGGGVTQ